MKQGIPMREIDSMSITRYLDVLAREIVQDKEVKELPKGTIEDVFG